jgi:hypothetical protein
MVKTISFDEETALELSEIALALGISQGKVIGKALAVFKKTLKVGVKQIKTYELEDADEEEIDECDRKKYAALEAEDEAEPEYDDDAMQEAMEKEEAARKAAEERALI